MTSVLLGTCDEPINKVFKNPLLSDSRSCSIYGECSVHNPTLVLAYTDGITNYNYASIFDRFYWITDCTLMPGKKAILSLSEDVLYTHAREIGDIPSPRVVVNEYVGQPLAYDDEYPTRVDNQIVRQYFSNDVMNTTMYLVTVLGGNPQYTSS